MYGIPGFLLATFIVFLGFPFIFFIMPFYLFFLLRGTHERAEKVQGKLQSLLMSNETINKSALEIRLNSLFARRRLIAITNSRIIFVYRNKLGGYDMKDCQWKDLIDVKLSENVFPTYFGSTLDFKFSNSPVAEIKISGIKSNMAAEIYAFSQREEQTWEEKKRIRSIEEDRAKAGGVHINGIPNVNNLGGKPHKDISEELMSVKKLLDDGTITDAEFQEIKSKILNKHFI